MFGRLAVCFMRPSQAANHSRESFFMFAHKEVVHAVLNKVNPHDDIQASPFAKELIFKMLSKDPILRPSVNELLQIPEIAQMVRLTEKRSL